MWLVAALCAVSLGACTFGEHRTNAAAFTQDRPPRGTSITGVSNDGKTLTIRIEHATCQRASPGAVVAHTKTVTVPIVLTSLVTPPVVCNAALRISAVNVHLPTAIEGRRVRIVYSAP
jgi:hypothetical protein